MKIFKILIQKLKNIWNILLENAFLSKEDAFFCQELRNGKYDEKLKKNGHKSGRELWEDF